MKTELESTKSINALKVYAINRGGYLKFKRQILRECKLHFIMFGVDLAPNDLRL